MYTVIMAALLTTTSQETQGHWGHWCRGCYGYNAFSCGGCWGCQGCHGCWGCAGCAGWGYSYAPYTVGYSYWGTGCYGSWCAGSASGWSWHPSVIYPVVIREVVKDSSSSMTDRGAAGRGSSGSGSGSGRSSSASGTTGPGTTGTTGSGTTGTGATGSTGAGVGTTGGTSTGPGVLGGGVGVTADPGVTPASPLEAEAVRKFLLELRTGKPATPTPPTPRKLPEQGSLPGNAARVIVQLASDAQLWVNDVRCPLAGEVRSFDTPPLQNGHQYYYTLTVELPKGGREDRRVALNPGQTTVVDFRPLAAATLQSARR